MLQRARALSNCHLEPAAERLREAARGEWRRRSKSCEMAIAMHRHSLMSFPNASFGGNLYLFRMLAPQSV